MNWKTEKNCRLLCIVLVVLCTFTVFLPWLKIGGASGDLVQYGYSLLGSYLGTSGSEITSVLKDNAISLSEAKKVISYISDSLNSLSGYLDSSSDETSSLLTKLSFLKFALQLCFLATFVFAALMLRKFITGKETHFENIYYFIFVFYFVLTINAWGICREKVAELNIQLHGWFYISVFICAALFYFQYEEEKLRGKTPMQALTLQDFDSERITQKGQELGKAGGEMLGDYKDKITVMVQQKQGWTCPKCNETRSGSQKFCPVCGTPRPEPLRCAACGALQQQGTKFCSKCGKPFVAQKYCKQCHAPLVPEMKFCEKCGAPVEENENGAE